MPQMMASTARRSMVRRVSSSAEKLCAKVRLLSAVSASPQNSSRFVSLVFMFGFPTCGWFGQFACSMPLSDHPFDAERAADQQIAVFENGRDAAEGVPEPAFPCIGLARAKRVDAERLV